MNDLKSGAQVDGSLGRMNKRALKMGKRRFG